MLVGFLAEYLIDNKIDKDRIKVLDMCSAPGSKAMYIANVSHKIHVSSRDISEYKRDLILENVERLGVDNIDVKVSDALTFDERSEGRYDLVLLDAPCSGLGVIRRKKDIKYNLSSDQVDELVDIQKKMLKNAAKYTRLDGYLIYSTCTINKQENEYQVEEFLDEHDEYELLYEKQLLTGIDNSDGFYVALLKRR
jgi:16S rRNA (cytosine967-C5)-methyltransferase